MLPAHLDGESIFAPDADNPGRLQRPFWEAPVHFRGRTDGETIWHFEGHLFPERPKNLTGAVVEDVQLTTWAELVSQQRIPGAPTAPAAL